MTLDHECQMRRAIEIAHGNPDAPFGTFIADHETGEVLAEGLNHAERSPLMHGEIDGILRLGKASPDGDWTRLVLYTTAEPCPMCASANLWCGILRVVYGTSIGTLRRLRLPQIGLPVVEVAGRSSFGGFEITGGILEGDCDALFEEMVRRASG